MSGFDGRMVGVGGDVVYLPKWLFLKLRRMHRNFAAADVPLLERDRSTGLWGMLPEAVTAFRPLWETVHFDPQRRLRAFDPGYESGRSPDSGYRNLLDRILGGVDPSVERIRECEADLEHSRLSAERVRQVVAEARRSRSASALSRNDPPLLGRSDPLVSVLLWIVFPRGARS